MITPALISNQSTRGPYPVSKPHPLHTPGPWTVIREVKPDTGLIFGIMQVHGDSPGWIGRLIAHGKSDVANVEADAALMAAAPELLAEVQIASKMIATMASVIRADAPARIKADVMVERMNRLLAKIVGGA